MTLTLEQAAAFLHMHPHTVQERARAGIIRGAKPGRRWVFMQSDLEAYLRSLQGAACPSTEEAIPGGSTSSIQDEELDGLVKQIIERSRNESTTNSERPSTGSDQVVELSTARSKRGAKPRNGTPQTNTA